MKLSTVRTYQTVRYNMRDESHFDLRIDRFKDLEMTLDPVTCIVTLKSPKETVLVFSTNIAYVVPAEVPKLAEAKKAK